MNLGTRVKTLLGALWAKTELPLIGLITTGIIALRNFIIALIQGIFGGGDF